MEDQYKKQSPIHPKCKGCDRTVVHAGTTYCSTYIKPSIWWKRGSCPLGSHIDRNDNEKNGQKIRVGQQKQRRNK